MERSQRENWKLIAGRGNHEINSAKILSLELADVMVIKLSQADNRKLITW